LDAVGFDHRVQSEGAAGFALAPTAVTTIDKERLAAHPVTNVAAGAAAFLSLR
jgi:hypothetical protein